MRNEAKLVQVAENTQRLVEFYVQSRIGGQRGLDNVDGFLERSQREATLREKVDQ
jgi:hypothetical protein